MRRRLVFCTISTLFFSAVSACAEQIDFVCYDENLRAQGLYEGSGAVQLIPTEVLFDTASQLGFRKGYDCQTVRWGDPNIFFTCFWTLPNGDFVLGAYVFNRILSQLASESVSNFNFNQFINDFEAGEVETTRKQKTYEQCYQKQF